MANPFKNLSGQLTGMVYDMIEVTPNDGSDNVGTGNVAIGLYIESAGDVSFQNRDGNIRTVAVPDNFYLVCSVKRVRSTGTTASGIHALVV